MMQCASFESTAAVAVACVRRYIHIVKELIIAHTRSLAHGSDDDDDW